LLHLDIKKTKVSKVFIEILYKDAFIFPLSDTKYSLLDKLTKKYPAYNNESPEMLGLFHPEMNKEITIQLNRLFLSWNSPNSIDDFIKSSKPDINLVLRTLKVDSIIRIGLRTYHTIECQNETQVSQYVFKQYLSPNIRNTEIFGENLSNPRVQFSGVKEGNKFNLMLGYQQERILKGNFGIQMEEIINNHFLADLDVYRENIKINSIDKMLNEAHLLNNKVPFYLKSLEGVPTHA
jgi:uncharacterized protein (TIGR04255 family)